MKCLATLALSLLPVTAAANLPSISEIDAMAAREHSASVHWVSVSPQLPFASQENATACAFSVDSLPDVLTLSTSAHAAQQIAFCLQN